MLGDTTEQRAARHAAGVEHRAVTPGPADTDVPSTHAPIVPALFDRSVAPFLGIEMPTVGTGIASYPVLGTSLTAGMVSEDTAGVQTAGSFDVTDADPRRLSGSFLIRKEDIAKLPSLEPALRENLSMVLSDEADKQFVNGNNTAPNLNGLLSQLTDPAAPASGAETFARYQTALSSHIDGLLATMPADIRMLVGPHTIRHMLGVYRANEDATTAYQLAMALYGGVRATRRIADPASNIQQAIVRRTNPAGDRVAVAPVWMGMGDHPGHLHEGARGASPSDRDRLGRRRRAPAVGRVRPGRFPSGVDRWPSKSWRARLSREKRATSDRKSSGGKRPASWAWSRSIGR